MALLPPINLWCVLFFFPLPEWPKVSPVFRNASLAAITANPDSFGTRQPNHLHLWSIATMSGINQIIQTFEGLGEGDREATMKALSTMMGVENQRQPAKKKVNGFMGYRGESTISYNLPNNSNTTQRITRLSSPVLHKKSGRLS